MNVQAVQGTVHGGSMNLDILGRRWAIVHSSGNNTGAHYNMNLAGETAMMTKSASSSATACRSTPSAWAARAAQFSST